MAVSYILHNPNGDDLSSHMPWRHWNHWSRSSGWLYREALWQTASVSLWLYQCWNISGREFVVAWRFCWSVQPFCQLLLVVLAVGIIHVCSEGQRHFPYGIDNQWIWWWGKLSVIASPMFEWTKSALVQFFLCMEMSSYLVGFPIILGRMSVGKLEVMPLTLVVFVIL